MHPKSRDQLSRARGWGPNEWSEGARPTLAEAGESEVLRRILAVAAGGQQLLVGPGDDAAVWRPVPGMDVVVTQDALVEGIDFVRSWYGPELLGARAVTVAVSDLAAMGAVPAWCQVTVAAPGATPLSALRHLQAGVLAGAARYGCALAGGDLSDTEGPLLVDVSAGGVVEPGRALRRGAAGDGDVLVVTGWLGGAAAGLDLLRGGTTSGSEVEERWLRRQIQPKARVDEGRALAAAEVRCGGDLSDGLLVDAARTADASGCGVELWRDRVPAEAGLREAYPARWPELALGGGEDFELLAAVPRERLESLLSGWEPSLAPLNVVGRFVAGTGLRLLETENGAAIDPPAVHSRHYR